MHMHSRQCTLLSDCQASKVKVDLPQACERDRAVAGQLDTGTLSFPYQHKSQHGASKSTEIL
jgi:hypothetical protein